MLNLLIHKIEVHTPHYLDRRGWGILFLQSGGGLKGAIVCGYYLGEYLLFLGMGGSVRVSHFQLLALHEDTQHSVGGVLGSALPIGVMLRIRDRHMLVMFGFKVMEPIGGMGRQGLLENFVASHPGRLFITLCHG